MEHLHFDIIFFYFIFQSVNVNKMKILRLFSKLNFGTHEFFRKRHVNEYSGSMNIQGQSNWLWNSLCSRFKHQIEHWICLKCSDDDQFLLKMEKYSIIEFDSNNNFVFFFYIIFFLNNVRVVIDNNSKINLIIYMVNKAQTK